MSQWGYEEVSLASLSFGSGCIDVLSFLGLGGVFTSAMTGNTALLAIAAGQGRGQAAYRSLCSLLGFSLGVMLATLLSPPRSTYQATWRSVTRILMFELVVIGGCALLWTHSPRPLEGNALYSIIALASVSMGIQAVGARSITSTGISSVVFTTGLVQIVMAATRRIVGRGSVVHAPSAHGHLLTFAVYGFGALVTALLIARYLGVLIWSPVVTVLVALGACVLAGQRLTPAA
jgi:uncharacterized membrane protein YoaK (UPF0700 family)